MTKQGLEAAHKYMQQINKESGLHYNTLREAGEKDGFEYYRYFNSELLHHYLGMPHYMKVNQLGQAFSVTEDDEIKWAMHHEVFINIL